METFEYTARSKDGRSVSGELVVANKKEAMVQLRSRGLQPLTLAEAKGGKSRAANKPQAVRTQISSKDVIMFTEELSELLNAGLPLEPALASMASREDEGPLLAREALDLHGEPGAAPEALVLRAGAGRIEAGGAPSRLWGRVGDK